MSIFGKLLERSLRVLVYSKKCQSRNGIRARRCYSQTDKPNIYLTRKINPEAMQCLLDNCDVELWEGEGPVPRDELIKNIADKQGLFCLLTDRIDAEVLDAAPDLKVISTMCAGLDHLDLVTIQAKNIGIGYTHGIIKVVTAETTVCLMMCTGRRLMEAAEEARNGGWSSWSPFWLCGQGLTGMVIGVVGAGGIGGEVLRQVKPFRPKQLLYINKTPRHDLEEELGAKQVELDELLEKSDYIVACMGLNKDTKEMFNEAAFKKMKKTAIFIITARGGVVDQDALIRALETKTIQAAGLDVTVPEPLPLDNPLFKMKNVVITPHIGSATYYTRNEMAMMTVENLVQGLKGKKMPSELKGEEMKAEIKSEKIPIELQD